MKPKELKLRASYFKDSKYRSDDCPIGRATIAQTDIKSVGVGGAFVRESMNRFNEFTFKYYSIFDFEYDLKKAEEANFSGRKIIRKIPIRWEEEC